MVNMQLLNIITLVMALQVAAAKQVPFDVRVTDQSGTPFSNVLVIVKSLDKNNEVGRYLTTKDGRTPPMHLEQGLYRVIATCPYGVCQTTVREFFGSQFLPEMELQVTVKPTDEVGQLVNAKKIRLVLQSKNQATLEGLHILVRNPSATRGERYVTDRKGNVDIELPSDPAIIVVVQDKKALLYRIGTTCPVEYIPTYPCFVIKDDAVQVFVATD
jgi:hypothetical protein